MTNHTYWNLSGFKNKIYNQDLLLNCSKYLPVDDTQIPIGEISNVENTPFDFRYGNKLSKETLDMIDGGGRNGLDHCFVIDGELNTLKHVATLSDDISGRMMTVYATQPGVQIYTANWLEMNNDNANPYTQHNAIAIETQHFPDSPNKNNFPTSILRPGQSYQHLAEFVFSVK